MGLQEDVITAAIERDDISTERMATVTEQRLYVDIYDVDGEWLRDIAVPFGIKDTLGFGLMMLDYHHKNLVVIDTRDRTLANASIQVADRGPL